MRLFCFVTFFLENLNPCHQSNNHKKQVERVRNNVEAQRNVLGPQTAAGVVLTATSMGNAHLCRTTQSPLQRRSFGTYEGFLEKMFHCYTFERRKKRALADTSFARTHIHTHKYIHMHVFKSRAGLRLQQHIQGRKHLECNKGLCKT